MFVWAGPSCCRPLPPVIVVVNEVLRGGMTARRVSGTDALASLLVSWTEADSSLGLLGTRAATTKVPVPPAGILCTSGATTPTLVKSDCVTLNSTGPLKPDAVDAAEMSVHRPATGWWTSTCEKLLKPCGMEYAVYVPLGSSRMTRIENPAGSDAALDTSSRSTPGCTVKWSSTKLRAIPNASTYAGAVAVLSWSVPSTLLTTRPTVRVLACTISGWSLTLRTVSRCTVAAPGWPTAVS